MDFSSKVGEMMGRRLVREWNPQTSLFRSWHETLDHQNIIRIIRPQRVDNLKKHYIFDIEGNFTGKW